MALDLSNKRIAVLGYGKEGRVTVAFLRTQGITVTAVHDAVELDSESQKYLRDNGIAVVAGPGYLDSLGDYDVLFRSPGIPRLHPKLLAFGDQAKIYSHTKLFFDLCPCPIIAVTGTKGKTTTSSLIHHILEHSGQTVFLGGNIGEPPLNFIDQLTTDAIVVLELSSFQCQDLHKSPHIAVVLDITQDHMGNGDFKAATHQTHQEYVNAKLQLLSHQVPADFAVVHPNVAATAENTGAGQRVVIDGSKYAAWDRVIPGDHNLQNIAAAAEACAAIGMTEDQIKSAVASFTGVAQRLQRVSEKNGLTYINDSASTNPDSTIAGIKSFNQNMVLIIGGTDKNLDYTELADLIKSSAHIRAVVVIGELTGKLVAALAGYAGQLLTGARDMQEIVAQAESAAQPGDVILFSPAAASFDMFKNSKDRGEQFTKVTQ